MTTEFHHSIVIETSGRSRVRLAVITTKVYDALENEMEK